TGWSCVSGGSGQGGNRFQGFGGHDGRDRPKDDREFFTRFGADNRVGHPVTRKNPCESERGGVEPVFACQVPELFGETEIFGRRAGALPAGGADEGTFRSAGGEKPPAEGTEGGNRYPETTTGRKHLVFDSAMAGAVSDLMDSR